MYCNRENLIGIEIAHLPVVRRGALDPMRPAGTKFTVCGIPGTARDSVREIDISA
jgi:hypothetical protein